MNIALMNLKGRLASRAILVLGLLGMACGASAQSWTDQSAMNVARVEATTVEYRDDIYVFNGFSPGIVIANSVEKYDVATKEWTQIGSTSTLNSSAVTHNGVVRVGADVWIIGGRVGSHPGRVSDQIWIYNLDSGSWRSGPDLPMPVAAGGSALVNNKIHWIGGIDENARCDVATHLTYDLGSPSAGWQDITASAGMPSPRNHFSTAVVDGVIYLMGGQYGHDGCPGKFTQDTVLVHAFDPATNSWTQKADMPNENSHSEPGTFVYKNDIYTTGGDGAGDKVWKYDPRQDSWSTFRTLPESLVAPIARIIDGDLIVAGGGAPTAALSSDRVYSMLVDNNPPALQPRPVVTIQPPEPGSDEPEGSTLISMEAEYFDNSTSTSTHEWVHVARGNSSNDDAMITTPDQGDLAGSVENTPMMSYMVYFNFPGKHYLWIRGSGDTNDSGIGNSDSIHVGLNGTVASSANIVDQFPTEWTWSRNTPSNAVASLNVVDAGVNAINFWMREDGLAIDKFIITSDPGFVPTGLGPDVTDGSIGYVPPSTSVEIESEVNPIVLVPVVTEPNEIEQTETIEGEVAENATNQQVKVSSGGFGGGTALTSLLALLAFSLLRACRCFRFVKNHDEANLVRFARV
jgi:N-acetylneuraminic acid mutarotase